MTQKSLDVFCQAKKSRIRKIFFCEKHQKSLVTSPASVLLCPRRAPHLTSSRLMFATLTLTFGSEIVEFRVVANEWMQKRVDAIVAEQTAKRGIAPDSIECR